MAAKSRNGYIDVIKFVFAIVIVLFHLGCGIFPGGRVAVEGFFMISAFLMMVKIDHDKEPELSIGPSTFKFIFRKYLGLLPFLISSIIFAFSVYSSMAPNPFDGIIENIVLLFFETFNLSIAGFSGTYVLGISWYLSAMFIALAILYPICRKYKEKFILGVAPALSILMYGFLDYSFGCLAVTTDYVEGLFICCGLIRALADSMLGCIIFEVYKFTRENKVTNFTRLVCTILELVGYAYFVLAMQFRAKTHHDYIVAFDIFVLLIIGICGLSFVSNIFRGNWTKFLGTMSTHLVLNHFCILSYVNYNYPIGTYSEKEYYLIFFGLLLASCIITQIGAMVFRFIIKKLSNKKLWIKEENK